MIATTPPLRENLWLVIRRQPARILVDEFAQHMMGKQPEDLVSAGIRNHQPLRVSTFRTTFSAAARAIGASDLHPHHLRHTAASLAIASGADVKVSSRCLGTVPRR